jgi:hypothetical protein
VEGELHDRGEVETGVTYDLGAVIHVSMRYVEIPE